MEASMDSVAPMDTTNPNAMNPNPINQDGVNQDGINQDGTNQDGINQDAMNLQAIAQAALGETGSPEFQAQESDAGASPKPISTSGTPPRSHERANFEEPEDLPDEDTPLTDEDIRKLFYVGNVYRKKYGEHFTTMGKVRKQHYGLLFERLQSGELRHPVPIIQSNVVRWRETLRHFEHPDKYDFKGRERDSLHKTKPVTVTLSDKRKRSATEDTPSESGSQTQDQIEGSQAEGADKWGLERESLTTTTSKPVSNKTAAALVGANIDTCEKGPFNTAPDVVSSVTGEFGGPIIEQIRRLMTSNDGPVPSRHVDSPAVGFHQFQQNPAWPQPITAHQHIPPTSHFSASGNYGNAVNGSCNDSHKRLGNQIDKDVQMAEATSGQTTQGQVVNARASRVNASARPDGSTLLDIDELSKFTRWLNAEVSRLNHNLMQAPAAGESKQYQECVNSVMVNLVMLRMNCFNLKDLLMLGRTDKE